MNGRHTRAILFGFPEQYARDDKHAKTENNADLQTTAAHYCFFRKKDMRWSVSSAG